MHLKLNLNRSSQKSLLKRQYKSVFKTFEQYESLPKLFTKNISVFLF